MAIKGFWCFLASSGALGVNGDKEMEWQKLLYLIGAILLVGLMFWTVRRNPQMFSKENISRSFFSLGILALILIAFIALLVWFLRAS